MLTLNGQIDQIEMDILTALFNAPEMRLRRIMIRNDIWPRYKKEYDSERSFDVVLQRKLHRLSWFLQRKYVGRSAFYLIRKERKEKVEKLIKENECQSLVPSLTAKWLGPLRNLLIRMKHEEPELALNNYCFTFIGDIPIAFTKSVEAMESHIAFETNLHQRHQRDLEKFREEFVSADRIGHAHIDARIKEEVGWTVGEYLGKLFKKAEKEKGLSKIMTALGITEEMLAEMTKNSESKPPTKRKKR